MSAQYTPGPWGHDAYGMWVYAKDGAMRICDIRGWGHLTGVGAMRLSPDDAIAIQTANARLIAAAPELLSVLKWVVNHSDECLGDHPQILNAAEALVSKAEGRA